MKQWYELGKFLCISVYKCTVTCGCVYIITCGWFFQVMMVTIDENLRYCYIMCWFICDRNVQKVNRRLAWAGSGHFSDVLWMRQLTVNAWVSWLIFNITLHSVSRDDYLLVKYGTMIILYCVKSRNNAQWISFSSYINFWSAGKDWLCWGEMYIDICCTILVNGL